MRILKKSWTQLVLLLVSLLIVAIWFRGGELIAGGEEGLWLFNPQRSLELYSSGWAEVGTGYVTAAFFPRIPVLLFAAFLGKFFSPWLSQAILFFLIIASGGTGMFYLAKEFVGDKNRWVPLVISLFYLLNLYSLTQVWNRLIYAGIFSWSYLPVIFLLSIKWLKTRKFFYLSLVFVSSFVYSAAFVTIAFVFAVWIPIGLYILYSLWEKRKGRKGVFTTSLSAFLLVTIWLLANVWWIYPFFSTTGTAFGQFVNLLEMNLATLQGVSQFFPTKEIVLLRQAYYFSGGDGRDSFWRDFYQSPIAYWLSYLVLFITVLGVIFSFKKRIKQRKYLLGLLLMGWFLVKGSNPPLGHQFYKFLFSNLGLTMMFRNPYEKLGLIFVLPYSIFFGLGVFKLSEKIRRLKLFLVGVLLVVLCGVLVWPFWTGDVYTNRVRLNIPEYYLAAKEIINEDPRDIRILFLPLINGEAAFYKWEYMGAVPVDFLFDKPVISRPVSSIYSYFQNLIDAFLNRDRKAIHRLFEELNIGYVVLAYDLEKERNLIQDPKELSEFLSSDQDLHFVARVGELSLYKFESGEVGKQITSAGKDIPETTYKKISPAKYEVFVTDAQGPFDLVFKSTYDSLWEAKIGDKKLLKHSLIYDYANQWEVGEKGSYKISVFLKIWPWQ